MYRNLGLGLTIVLVITMALAGCGGVSNSVTPSVSPSTSTSPTPTPSTSPGSTNMIVNGDFEADLNADGEAWNGWGGGTTTLERVNTDSDFSGYYLHYSNTDFSSVNTYGVQLTKQTSDYSANISYGLTANTTYTFKFKAKANPAGKIQVVLQEGSNWIANQTFDISTTVDEYSFTYSDTAAHSVNIWFNFGGNVNTAGTNFYIDDIELSY